MALKWRGREGVHHQVAAPLNDRQVADLVNDQERGPGTGSGSVRAAGHGGFRTGKGQETIRIFPRGSSGAARPQFCAARGPGSENASKVCWAGVSPKRRGAPRSHRRADLRQMGAGDCLGFAFSSSRFSAAFDSAAW